MTKRDCMTCKHLLASPSPCGGCVFSRELPAWEPTEKPLTFAEQEANLQTLLASVQTTPPGPTHMPRLNDTERAEVGLPPLAEWVARPGGLDGTGKENPKAQYGRAKPQLGLLPAAALIEMAGAMELGAAKYGAANWREDPVQSMTYAHAGLRHVLSWIDGENIDPESGCSHLAHAMACFGIIIDAGHVGAMIDNRPLTGAAGRLIRERTKAVA